MYDALGGLEEMSTWEPHLVSVIIPCSNGARFLPEAIESVLGQTYLQFEIIVVDYGSTDNSGEIAVRYPSVRYIRQENQGVAAARNTGQYLNLQGNSFSQGATIGCSSTCHRLIDAISSASASIREICWQLTILSHLKY